MATRVLLWTLDPIGGFDAAWVATEGGSLRAEGQQAGLSPRPYLVRYRLETDAELVTARMELESRWEGGQASLDLRRDARQGWTANGEPRPELGPALDVDLACCPLTNTMPILRGGHLRAARDAEYVMAFVQVPELRISAARQRYAHVRSLPGERALVRYSSGTFRSDLTIDAEGFVVEYPQLGRRLGSADVPAE